ncbi:MAG: hypothetical protein ACRENB_05350 [Gemmatimonadales bacterium]
MDAVVGFLDSLSSAVFRFAVVCFVVINGSAALAVVMTRSRRLVDAWVPRLLAADAALLGVGLGVPLMAGLAKFGVRAIGAMFGGRTAGE